MSKRIWITSDWHFNHEPIKDFEWREEWYEQEIIRRINNQVKEDDILINLWDVIFSNASELKDYISKFKCKNIILVRWNHDKWSYDFYLNHWFSFVCDEFKLRWQQQPIIFSHIPIKNLPYGYINIHGHLHSGWHRDGINDWRHYLYNPEKTGSRFIPTLLQHIVWKHKTLVESRWLTIHDVHMWNIARKVTWSYPFRMITGLWKFLFRKR